MVAYLVMYYDTYVEMVVYLSPHNFSNNTCMIGVFVRMLSKHMHAAPRFAM